MAQQPDRFPRLREAQAVAMATRSDLVSFGGAICVAVALTLGAEISPGGPNASVVNRCEHGLLVVLIVLGALVAADLFLRLATYELTAKQRWEVRLVAETHGAKHLVIDARDPRRWPLPTYLRVLIRDPVGRVAADQNDPNVVWGGNAWFVGPGFLFCEGGRPLVPGRHEVRIYDGDGAQLVRSFVDVPE